MEATKPFPEYPEEVPASLSPGELDRLSDLIVAKPAPKNEADKFGRVYSKDNMPGLK